MANLRNVILKITGDPVDAKAALADVTQDLRRFDALSAEARADVKTEGAKAKLDVLMARLDNLRKQEASPQVSIKTAAVLAQIERIELQLAKLDHKKVEVDVDVKRGALDRVGSSLSGALSSITAALGGSGGNPIKLFGTLLGELGPQAAAAGGAIVLSLIPAVIALAASLAAAVAGLGALAIAFGAALGPAVLVTVAAFASLAKILKAVQERHQQAATQATAVASAQSQITAATDQLASAQSNLADQTTAAYQAMSDSIEKVKDDLLGVQHAQVGIEQSNLNLQKAQLALKQFRSSLGAGGHELDGLFKRFSDINFKGDPAAITSALAGQGKSLSGDDSLKLQQLILDVKDAKLGEKDATDRLHDSNVQLARDRKTEADFAAHGIAAYKPYIAALAQVDGAQRSLAGAERARTTALTNQSKAWKDLTPSEQKFADTILLVESRIKRAFGPALTALFGGLADGLKSATKSLNDKRVVGAFEDVGKAIGSVFASIGKTLSNPEIVNAFVTLAKGGAQLVKVLGTKVFTDLFVILTNIAIAALPDLLDLFKSIGKFLDKLTDGTKNGEELRKKVHDLIESTKLWLEAVIKVGGGFIKLVGFASGAGDTILRAILHPIDALKSLGRALGLTRDDFSSLRSAGRTVQTVFEAVADKAITPLRELLRGLRDTVRGVVRVVSGILSGDWAEVWKGAKDVVKGVVESIIGFFGTMTAPLRAAGEAIGKALAKAIKGAFTGIVGFIKGVMNDVIGIFNHVIGAINSATPGAIKILGKTITPGIPDIPKIAKLADGGVAVRATLAQIGEAGNEAVIPLRSSVLAQLGKAIAAASAPPQMTPALAGVAHGTRIDQVHAHITTPGGQAPDAEYLGEQLENKFRRMGRGRP